MSKKELSYIFFGLILVSSCSVFLLTNIFWDYLPKIPIHEFFNFKINTKIPRDQQTQIGDWLCYLTMFTAFTCSLIVSRKYFKKESFAFFLWADFFANLCGSKVLTILFANPFEYHINEFVGLGFAILVLIIRLIKKK